MGQRLYILVRKDLTVAQQGVQAGHAVAEWCRVHWWTPVPEARWQNHTLIYVTVADEETLHLWLRKCVQRPTIKWAMFHEPDLHGQLTAVAAMTSGNLFDKLPLWDPRTEALEARIAELENQLFEERMGEDL